MQRGPQDVVRAVDHVAGVPDDLLVVLTLRGKPCGKVVEHDRKAHDDYVVLCESGDRYRVRVDMTSDRLWSSTSSTRDLLGRLEKQLLVEAYFSPKEELPVQNRAARDWAWTNVPYPQGFVSYIDPANTRSIAVARRLGAVEDTTATHPFGEETCLVFRHPTAEPVQ